MAVQLQSLAALPPTHLGSEIGVNKGLFDKRYSFDTLNNLSSSSTSDKSFKVQPAVARNENQDSTWYSLEPDEVLLKKGLHPRVGFERVIAESNLEFSETESEASESVDDSPETVPAEVEVIEASESLESDVTPIEDEAAKARDDLESDVTPIQDEAAEARDNLESDDEELDDDPEDDWDDELDDDLEEDEEFDEESDDELDEDEECAEQLEASESDVESVGDEAAEASNDSEPDAASEEENDWRAEPANDAVWTELRDKARDAAAVDKAVLDVAPQSFDVTRPCLGG